MRERVRRAIAQEREREREARVGVRVGVMERRERRKFSPPFIARKSEEN